MKKEFIYAAVAVLALSGCSKNDVEPVVVTDSELLSFTVGVDPVQTKSMLEYDEGKVEDVQVFVFNHQGYLEAYYHGQSLTAEFKCTEGEKRVYAMVNADDHSTVSLVTEISDMVSNIYNDNDVSRFLMTGQTTMTVSKSNSVNKCSVEVSRLVSKVTLGTVTLDFQAEHYAQKRFTIDAVYLLNIPQNTNCFLEPSPGVTSYYNLTRLVSPGSESALFCDVLSSSAVVTEATPYKAVHNFYTYPNLGTTYTKLVVESTIDGKRCYYPVEIPSIGRNKVYTVNLLIRRPGSSQPNEPVSTYDANSGITVAEWGESILVEKEL